MDMIEVKNLKRNYKTYQRGSTFTETLKGLFYRKEIVIEALKGISFSLEKGELAALLGPNGAGKSTTLKILSGILFPTSGEVKVLNYVPWKDRKKYVYNIGVVFGQKSQLIWDIPPVDSFTMNKAIYDIPDAKFNKNLGRLTEILNVRDIIRKPTRLLSLGERMKCEFIMAMLHDPQVVFLDEPTIGLDVIAKDNIRKFILEMNKLGTTFILTTHDLGDVEHLARKVIVINHGEIVFNDQLKGLRNHIGSRKIIKLSTREQLPELNIPGVSTIKVISNYEVELELDVSVIELNQFITNINKQSISADISIQDIPIEELIKQLYLSKS
jgi:ABC-2 type transport system ATP-binding protein